MSEILLQVENIRKSFVQCKEVLRGISLSVARGEVIAIIGSSGSGKSTLLRCVTHLEEIDSGCIRVCGEELVHTSPDGHAVYADRKKEKEIQLKLGMVFQSFNLFPHYTVMRNIIDAPVRILGIPREQAQATAMALLQKMNLDDRADAYPCQLSGGQQQRVAIARALALGPDILCFDEPTSALDPELTGEVLKVIRSLKTEGRTMIVVTHEMAFARNVADRVLFMADGVIVEEGDAKSIMDAPKTPQLRTFLQRAEQSRQ